MITHCHTSKTDAKSNCKMEEVKNQSNLIRESEKVTI